MDTVTDFIKFLKSRQSFHSRRGLRLGTVNPDAATKHTHTASSHSEIIKWFESYLLSSELPSSEDSDLFSLNLLELNNLPDEFVQELSVSVSDEQDAQLLELLKIANRPLDLNELLVGAYRKYNVQHKRSLLTGKLYRLSKRYLVHTVGKGTYALGASPEEENIKESFDEKIAKVNKDLADTLF